MRVAYVSSDPGVPVFGRKGASVHVQSVLGVLTRQGADVHLLTTRVGGDPPPGLSDVHLHPLPLAAAFTAEGREAAARAADSRVSTVLSRLHHVVPLDLVYERYSLWGRSATAWAFRQGVPSVLEVNAPLVEEQRNHRTLVDVSGAEQVAAEALSRAGTVVCVSDAVAAWARAHSKHPARVHTVANGVDTQRVRPAAEPPPERPFTVGFVGTLKPWHGVEGLVHAVALLAATGQPDYRLLLVGDGPRSESLRSLAASLDVDHLVEMAGAVPPHDVPALLHRMHVAVAPYPDLADFYFSPLKVYEYLAAGLPVVATRVGDLPTVLGGGRHGVLVPPGDPATLAAAISDLRADRARRASLGRQARAAAVERHDWTAVVTRVLTLAEGSHGAA